jgi:glycerophosphoryl diester phosphodiesterase
VIGMLVFAASVIIIAALCTASYLWALWPAAWPDSSPSGSKAGLSGARFAHRGLFNNTKGIPENSLVAFSRAIDKGYGIELDVRLTKDGQLVVFHDPGLARMCSLPKAVEALTAEELRSLRLLGTDSTIPTFAEVLALVDGKVPLLVEIKTGLPGAADVSSLCQRIASALDGYTGPYYIESFDHLVLAWFRRHRPAVVRGQLGMGFHCYVPALGKKAASLIPWHRRIMLSWLLYNYRGRPHFISYRHQDTHVGVRLCKRAGAPLCAWTILSADEAASIRNLYDGIIFEQFEA